MPGGTPASPDVAPTVGITGTPAINPATNTMYVVGATKENGGLLLAAARHQYPYRRRAG